MDIFGAVATAVHEIHVVFLLIRKVVDDVRSYDSDIGEMRDRLAHETVFFEQFKSLYFQNEDGKKLFCKLDPEIQDDFNRSLGRVSAELGQHQAVASRHGIDFTLLTASVAQSSTSPAHPLAPTNSQENWFSAFNAKFASIVEDLKKKAGHWSLFDKDTLEGMVRKVRAWVKRLRETLTMTKLLLVREADMTVRGQSILNGLSVIQAVRRQTIAQVSVPDPSFGPLTGKVNISAPVYDHFGVVTYVEGSFEQSMIFEIKKYDQKLEDAAKSGSATEMEKALVPVRQLAWLLHESKFQEGIETDVKDGASPQIMGLEFSGYLNMPDQLQTVFLYEIPQAVERWSDSSLTTLYDFINDTSGKPQQLSLTQESLGNRYYIAHVLAITLLNIHCSLWVHKNIRSSVFVMHSWKNSKHSQRTLRPIPFVAGWGFARPELGDRDAFSALTADFEIVANLYRHPRRRGKPDQMFKMDHDVYSLGIVLVEVGLWKTVDKVFTSDIIRCEADKRSMPEQHFSRWWKSRGRDQIIQSMGEGYAEVVEWCTKDRQPTATRETKLLNFRSSVVDMLAKGQDL